MIRLLVILTMVLWGLPGYAVRVAVNFDSHHPKRTADLQAKIKVDKRITHIEMFDPLAMGPHVKRFKGFDAVLVWYSRPEIPNYLTDLRNAGVGIVIMGYPTHAFRSLLSWMPLQCKGWGISAFQLRQQAQVAHPVTSRVSNISGGSTLIGSQCSTTNSAIALLNTAVGEPLVAVRDEAPARSVSIVYYPISSDAAKRGWAAGTDGGRLMTNALVWVAGGNTPIAPVKKPPKPTAPPKYDLEFSPK